MNFQLYIIRHILKILWFIGFYVKPEVRQALFVVSVLMAKPVFIVSVLMAKPVFVVSVGLRVFQKNQKLTNFFVNLKNEIIKCLMHKIFFLKIF